MVKRIKVKVSPFRQELDIPAPAKDCTPLSYYGGKLRDADWVISQFPPHEFYVEVFGGGAAVFFAKKPSANDIYNDFGNVAIFWRVMQNWSEELYQKLYWSPYSRDEFDMCANTWEDWARKSKETGEKEDYIEFARRWYITVSLSYSHREDDKSFKLAVQVNNGRGFANHVDGIPYVAERLRSSIIEHCHFRDCLRLYDRPGTLFYMDPPYLPETRVSNGTYRREMTVEEHIEMLEMVTSPKFQAQCIISGYDSDLYNSYLKDWRIVRKTMPSAIQNRSQLDGRAMRTEVLWIRERAYGLWSFLSDQSQAAMAGVSDQVTDEAEPLPVSE